mgnify:FL=1
MLFKVISLHLALHLKISPILCEYIGSLYEYQEDNHNLLLIFRDNSMKELDEAPSGAWTQLRNELKTRR